jgi:hypothetical protein
MTGAQRDVVRERTILITLDLLLVVGVAYLVVVVK